MLLPVDRKGHAGVAFLLHGGGKLLQFPPVKQQLARAQWVGDHVGASGGQRCDMATYKPGLVVLQQNIAVDQLGFAGAQTFNFPASQNQTCFEFMFDEVVVTGFLVLGNGALRVFLLLGHRGAIIGSRGPRGYGKGLSLRGAEETRTIGAVIGCGWAVDPLRHCSSEICMTTRILRSALLPYPAAVLYGLVNDVARYPEFLPWCSATEVLEVSDVQMLARLVIAKGGLSQRFVTRNQLQPGQRIEMNLEEGPFSQLNGVWEFKALGEQACKISLDLSFDYAGPLVKATLGPLFNQAANTLVDAFCQRVKQLHG